MHLGVEGPPLGSPRYPLGRRVLDAFVAPVRLFETVRGSTPWVGPLLVVALVGAAIVLLIPSDLFVQEARESLRRSGETGATAPTAEQVATVGRLAAVMGGLVGTPIVAFIIAGVLTLAFSIVGGGAATYVQYLTVTTHAMLITALGGCVTFPIQVARGDLRAGLSLGSLPWFDGSAVTVARVAQGIDPFTLWSLAITGVGVAVMNGREERATPAVIVVGLYLLTLVGIALISG